MKRKKNAKQTWKITSRKRGKKAGYMYILHTVRYDLRGDDDYNQRVKYVLKLKLNSINTQQAYKYFYFFIYRN